MVGIAVIHKNYSNCISSYLKTQWMHIWISNLNPESDPFTFTQRSYKKVWRLRYYIHKFWACLNSCLANRRCCQLSAIPYTGLNVVQWVCCYQGLQLSTFPAFFWYIRLHWAATIFNYAKYDIFHFHSKLFIYFWNMELITHCITTLLIVATKYALACDTFLITRWTKIPPNVLCRH
jgi:hypothetical protein